MRKTLVKLKPGEAAILFRNEGVLLARGDQEEQLSPLTENAACIVYALQHPLFMQIVMQFLGEIQELTHKMQTAKPETVH
jgi:hypothetical protein